MQTMRLAKSVLVAFDDLRLALSLCWLCTVPLRAMPGTFSTLEVWPLRPFLVRLFYADRQGRYRSTEYGSNSRQRICGRRRLRRTRTRLQTNRTARSDLQKVRESTGVSLAAAPRRYLQTLGRIHELPLRHLLRALPGLEFMAPQTSAGIGASVPLADTMDTTVVS